MSGIRKALRDLLFPPKCAACGDLLPWEPTAQNPAALCSDCRKAWESEKLETCGICAQRITECTCMPDFLRWSGCSEFSKLVYYSPRERTKVQNKVIYSVKRHNSRNTQDFLASELLPAVQKLRQKALDSGSDPEKFVLTYIPRRAGALSDYGTDQARELAVALSRVSGIPAEKLIFRRRGARKEQKKLSAPMRFRNASKAYYVKPDAQVKGRTVLLVDDLVTTGASMAVPTRLLRKKGAKAVCAIAVANDECNRDLPAVPNTPGKAPDGEPKSTARPVFSQNLKKRS